MDKYNLMHIVYNFDSLLQTMSGKNLYDVLLALII